jgi:excinuclease ABC subunit A
MPKNKKTNSIIIKGARVHNLKNIDVEIPRDKFVVITGLSGSGKSTLAFDTIYAEGQRRYVESLSAYARQFLGIMNKPDCDSIEGLSPAISIEQKSTSKNPRSTVGTVTEIYDHLRLLFARIGIPHCPTHHLPITALSPQTITRRISKAFSGQLTILSPVIRQKKGTYEKLFKDLNMDGYSRVRVNGTFYRTDDTIKLDRYKKHNIEIVIDNVQSSDNQRLSEAVENGLKKSDSLLRVIDPDGNEKTYSSKMACIECDTIFEELQPRMFSFNSPFGACKTCHGLGIKMDFDPDLIIPDKTKCIAERAIHLYRNAIDGWRGQYLAAVAKHFDFSPLTPIRDLNDKQFKALMYGSREKIKFSMSMKNGDANFTHTGNWEGLIPQSERLYKQTNSDYRRRELQKFMRISTCQTCQGKRLNEKALAVKIDSHSIADISDKPIKDCVNFFNNLHLNKKEKLISRQIVKEIKDRLNFLDKVGLNYLNLSRSFATISGGEAQRIRLATQIGSNLMGVLYIMDEPSIGLHQRDNQKLIDTLHKLRDLGNTLLVVEHDEETIKKADHIIDMGPGAGLEGGRVIAEGDLQAILGNQDSLTGQYISGKLSIPIPKKRKLSSKYIRIINCSQNNLKNIDVKIPIGVLNVITGVSGSGKSTLIYETLFKGLRNKLYKSNIKCGNHREIILDSVIDKVIVIDQNPIGKTPRSNPVTYTKIFDYIRNIFAETSEAKSRGYKTGRFSFNVKGGRCETCSGDGIIKIEMNFLPDVYIQCEECKGKRYNEQTLQVKFKNKSIADVLDMSVNQAHKLFENQALIRNKIETLQKVGLGYIKLGQSSTTLSGGEAQRIKLTRELSKRATGNTLYILDEPTTGLHFHDVNKLINVLNSLVSKGNTVIVIEHNLDIIKSADHIIDLGPEGGENGGYTIAEGTPEEICKVKKSYTGQFLHNILND